MVQKEIIDKVKLLTSIVAVVGAKVQLKKQTGDRWLGLCPFHKERTPSFTVNEAEGFFHCFGCQIHGDVIEFLQKIENITFLEALQKLGESVGVSIELSGGADPDMGAQKLWRSIMSEACSFYSNNLEQQTSSLSIDALRYMQRRGLSIDNIKKFKIGCTHDSARRDSLHRYLTGKNYPYKALMELGLVQEKNRSYYDFFSHRIIIPICDHMGRVIGFGGRVINDKLSPKYLNSPESVLFKKKSLLFNLHQAKSYLAAGGNEVIVVEGYMDAIMLQQHGFCGVATLGTAVTEFQISAILNVTKTPVICFDNDIAGKNATIKFVKMLLPVLDIGHKPRFMLLEGVKDIDELLQCKDGKILLRSAIDKSLELQEFIWYVLSRRYPVDNPNTKSQLEAAIAQYKSSITNGIIRKNYEDFFRRKLYEATYLRLGNRKSRDNISPDKQRFANANSLKMTARNLEIALLGIVMSFPRVLSTMQLQQEEYKIDFVILEEMYSEYIRLLTLKYDCDKDGVLGIDMAHYNKGDMLDRLSQSLSHRRADIADIKSYIATLQQDKWIQEDTVGLYLRKGIVMYHLYQIDASMGALDDDTASKDLDFFTKERNRLAQELATLDEEINRMISDGF